MARLTQRLTAVEVSSNSKRPGMYADGDGLYLRVTKSGTKAWIFRYSVDGRLRDMGLGTLSAVSLANARKLAADCRRIRSAGRDPIKVREQERASNKIAATRAMTFADCAEQLVVSHSAGWRNAKHCQQWRNTLKTYAYPILGHLPVSEIDTNLILVVLEQKVSISLGKTDTLWNAKTETASRLRGRIEAVLSWAKARGLREGDNPAQWRGCMDQLLPARSRVRRVEHHAALPYTELPGLMTNLRKNNSISARALEFVVLTALAPARRSARVSRSSI